SQFLFVRRLELSGDLDVGRRRLVRFRYITDSSLIFTKPDLTGVGLAPSLLRRFDPAGDRHQLESTRPAQLASRFDDALPLSRLGCFQCKDGPADLVLVTSEVVGDPPELRDQGVDSFDVSVDAGGAAGGDGVGGDGGGGVGGGRTLELCRRAI